MASLIEPSSFDLIVLGTGLPQCIIAAAAASSGHTVLHLDSCDFYGSHWASLPFQDFSDWCHSAGQLPFPSSSQVPALPSESRADNGVCSDTLHHGSPSIATSSLEVRDQEHDGSPSIETSSLQVRDLAKEANAQDERDTSVEEFVEGTLQDGTGILDIKPEGATKKFLGEKGQYAVGSEDGSKQTQGHDISRASDDGGVCSLSEVLAAADAPDGQESASKDNGCSLAASTMEEMGLEPFVAEPSTSMYRNFHVMPSSVESLGLSRSYCIDLAGPKLAFCSGPLIDLLLRSGASNYLEFKNLEGSFMWSPQGFSPVPSSRADVFKDRTLSNAEKRHLMRFFKLVLDHTSSNSDTSQISKEDMESPFVEFLQARHVPSSVQAMILYAIALSNKKQDPTEKGQCAIMSTREGMESLTLYLTSVGRFVNATGAFLYPLYGQGELPQAFSRSAAVKGALYALKMPVHAFLRDKETCKFKGVQMSTNQLIFSEKLVVGPSMYSTLCKGFSSETKRENGGALDEFDGHEESLKVVRSICITDKSLRSDLSTLLVVFPPESISAEESGVIRALQLGSSVAVCPEGKFLVQLSLACLNESVGMKALQLATQSLFHCRDSTGDAVEDKPTLLWAVYYVHDGIYPQGAKWISTGCISVCGMPDETLHFENVVASAETVFKGLYPEEVFFCGTSSSVVDDAGVNEEVQDTDINAADTTET